MAHPFLSFRKLLLTACGLGLLANFARADLVWTPGSGWRVESGALSGLRPAENRNAVGLMNAARAAEVKGDNWSALSKYSQVAKKYGSSIYAPEALYHVGKLRLARKQYFKAFEAFQTIVAGYPNVRRFDEVVGLQYRIGGDLLDGGRNHVWGFLPLFKNRERGIQYLEVVVQDAPYGDYAPLALTAAARAEEQNGDTEDAIDMLDRLVNSYSQSVLVPDAYISLGRMHSQLVAGPYYDQDETKQAMTYYEDFMILFPGDANIATAAAGLDSMRNLLAESKMKIGDFYFYKRDNYTAARVFYNEAITSYPDSAVAKRASKRLAEVDAKANKAAQPVPAKGAKKKWLGIFEPGRLLTMRARPILAGLLLPFALASFLVGCSHYQLGTEGKLAFTTLYIAPVANRVLLPQAQAVVSTEVRAAFARDGRVTLVDSPQAADAVLTLAITDYHRDMVATRETDVGLASKFAVTLGVTCSLRDIRSGHPYFENRVIAAERDVYTDNGQPSSPLTGDQLQAEYNTLPLLAGSLADKITHAVLDVW